ncbi:hypothetical protein, partial [Prevotella falsenii]|uniref:hypothetical protein n=1 Tax=Prevotella falsenii TaxID=515414 RepID=UPI001E32C0B9
SSSRLFYVILSPFISRVARYTPSSRRQTDREIAVNTMSINYEHLLINIFVCPFYTMKIGGTEGVVSLLP